MKFGGLSVGTTTALTQVLSIVLHEHERWKRLILVVSALEGVTDALLEAVRLAQVSNRRGYRRIVATLRTRHLALIDHLPLSHNERRAIQADVDRLLFDMLDQLQTLASEPSEDVPKGTVDAIVGTGERMAARIVAALIRQNNIRAVAIDAYEIIVTDDTFGNATPDIDASYARVTTNLLPMLDRSIIPVITGFIGTTADGRTTTLGRGGSDYTASVVSVCCGAEALWIWSDVDGMMTTDPRDLDNARVIPEMSYTEVGEMAFFGARVLHAHMIHPLRAVEIPLRIKNVFKPQQPGTLIHDIAGLPSHLPKAVTVIQGVALEADRSGLLSDVIATTNDVLIQHTGTAAQVMIASQSSTHSLMCFVIPTTSGPGAQRAVVDSLSEQLSRDDLGDSALWTVSPVTMITVIGSQINEAPLILAQIYQHLSGINILAVAQGPSQCSLSIVIPPDQTYDAQSRIHNYVLELT